MAAVVNKSVGMMDDAYFVGRKPILDWLNDLLALKLTKIEETASGAVACQVLDALFPGQVPMAKVNWGAKTDYEFVANYKVLQSVFAALKIDRAIEVDRLIRARYQDNLEFMQWLKKFYEDNSSGASTDYDAAGRRAKGKGAALFLPAQGGAAVKVKPSSRDKAKLLPAPTPSKAAKVSLGAASAGAGSAASGASPLKENAPAPARNKSAGGPGKDELAELKLQAENLEKERDFYFTKLREVEVLLQNYAGPDRAIVREVLKVLYANEDDVTGEAALAAAESAMAEAGQEGKEAPASVDEY